MWAVPRWPAVRRYQLYQVAFGRRQDTAIGYERATAGSVRPHRPKFEQAGLIEDNSAMAPHDHPNLGVWIVEFLVVVDLEGGPHTGWAYASDALPVYAGQYLDIARNGGQHLPQVELDRCTAGLNPEEGAAVRRHDGDRHEREKDRGDQGEEIPAPSSVPMALQVWPDAFRA
jgi:hypothetical protein